MAKPKFELTADLVKVEPEPKTVEHRDEYHQAVRVVEQKEVSYSLPTNEQIYPPSQLGERTSKPNVMVNQQPEIEREAISMKISKDLKKSFHLWCVQRELTMTDAIEAAIKKYLQE